jgi:hypothetical protein
MLPAGLSLELSAKTSKRRLVSVHGAPSAFLRLRGCEK